MVAFSTEGVLFRTSYSSGQSPVFYCRETILSVSWAPAYKWNGIHLYFKKLFRLYGMSIVSVWLAYLFTILRAFPAKEKTILLIFILFIYSFFFFIFSYTNIAKAKMFRRKDWATRCYNLSIGASQLHQKGNKMCIDWYV